MMPQTFRLPLGVSMCVVPAGFYLCRQCERDEQGKAFERMVERADAMQHGDAVSLRLQPAASAAPDLGGVPLCGEAEEFRGDERLRGWFRRFSSADVRNLRLLERAALAPEDGYCVVTQSLFLADCNDRPRFEMQMMLDPASVKPYLDAAEKTSPA